MKKTIFIKALSTYLLIVVMLSTLTLVLSFRAIRSHYLDTLSESLENLGTTATSRVAPLLDEGRFEELDALVKALGRKIDTRITVIDLEGAVLGDSEKDPELMENHRTRPEVIQALKGEVGRSLRFSTTVSEEMLYVALPIQKDGRISGVVRVSLFLTDVNSLLSDLKMRIVYIGVAIAAVSLFAAFFFSRSLSNPIRQLGVASQKLASGDFDARVFLKRSDELQELGRSFNYMAEQTKRLFTQVSHQKEELHSIVSSLQEGLLLVDKEGRILLSNQSVQRFAGTDTVTGKLYWEILREPALDELIGKVRSEKRNATGEVRLGERTFLCSGTHLAPRDRVLLVLRDITEAKSLEKTKRDFVVNVSHELHTPLTAIKGFVETLEEEAGEKARHYLDIIKRHTDRLVNIVRDLLVLSELEERGAMLELERVSLKDTIGNVQRVFEPRLKEKNLEFKVKVPQDIPHIKGDPFKLEQMFMNLLDNAAKYSEKGEISVSLRKKNDRAVTVEVKDTGIGISEENLPRIFERFYVVNKSRSRKLGGTGLGLSIVKHIVLLHNGKIDVESTPGVGTKLSITLPVNPS